MDGIVNTYSNSRRSFVSDYTLKASNQTTSSNVTRSSLRYNFVANITTASISRRSFLTSYLLVGRVDSFSNSRRSFIFDDALVGRIDASSNATNAFLLNDFPAGLYGISLILSDRQIITERPAIQGVSLI